MQDLAIEMKSVESLNNYRTLCDEQVAYIATSIIKSGFTLIIIDEIPGSNTELGRLLVSLFNN